MSEPYPENPIPTCDGTHGGCERCNRCLGGMKLTQEHERRMAELANVQCTEILNTLQ